MNEVETRIVAIVTELLEGADREGVAVTLESRLHGEDGLGLDSLQTAELSVMLEDEIGREVRRVQLPARPAGATLEVPLALDGLAADPEGVGAVVEVVVVVLHDRRVAVHPRPGASGARQGLAHVLRRARDAAERVRELAFHTRRAVREPFAQVFAVDVARQRIFQVRLGRAAFATQSLEQQHATDHGEEGQQRRPVPVAVAPAD